MVYRIQFTTICSNVRLSIVTSHVASTFSNVAALASTTATKPNCNQPEPEQNGDDRHTCEHFSQRSPPTTQRLLNAARSVELGELTIKRTERQVACLARYSSTKHSEKAKRGTLRSCSNAAATASASWSVSAACASKRSTANAMCSGVRSYTASSTHSVSANTRCDTQAPLAMNFSAKLTC
jgi:hypothetical protein